MHLNPVCSGKRKCNHLLPTRSTGNFQPSCSTRRVLLGDSWRDRAPETGRICCWDGQKASREKNVANVPTQERGFGWKFHLKGVCSGGVSLFLQTACCDSAVLIPALAFGLCQMLG